MFVNRNRLTFAAELWLLILNAVARIGYVLPLRRRCPRTMAGFHGRTTARRAVQRNGGCPKFRPFTTTDRANRGPTDCRVMITSRRRRRRGSGQSRSNGVVSITRKLRAIRPTVPGKTQAAESCGRQLRQTEEVWTQCETDDFFFYNSTKFAAFFSLRRRRSTVTVPTFSDSYRGNTGCSGGGEREGPAVSRPHPPPIPTTTPMATVFRFRRWRQSLSNGIRLFFLPFPPSFPSPPHLFARRRPCT